MFVRFFTCECRYKFLHFCCYSGPLNKCTLFILSSADGHLGFSLLDIMNNVTMNIDITSFGAYAPVLFLTYLKSAFYFFTLFLLFCLVLLL